MNKLIKHTKDSGAEKEKATTEQLDRVAKLAGAIIDIDPNTEEVTDPTRSGHFFLSDTFEIEGNIIDIRFGSVGSYEPGARPEDHANHDKLTVRLREADGKGGALSENWPLVGVVGHGDAVPDDSLTGNGNKDGLDISRYISGKEAEQILPKLEAQLASLAVSQASSK